jgi:hypothetical protein
VHDKRPACGSIGGANYRAFIALLVAALALAACQAAVLALQLAASVRAAPRVHVAGAPPAHARWKRPRAARHACRARRRAGERGRARLRRSMALEHRHRHRHAAAPAGGGALGAARAPALRTAWAALLAGAAGAGGAVAELLAFHARLACLGLSTYGFVLRQRAAAADAAARAGAPERALGGWGGGRRASSGAAPPGMPRWSCAPCAARLLRGGDREDPRPCPGRAWGVGRALGAALVTARSSCSMPFPWAVLHDPHGLVQRSSWLVHFWASQTRTACMFVDMHSGKLPR